MIPPACPRFFYAVGLSLIGSFGGLLLASALLLFPDGFRAKIVPLAGELRRRHAARRGAARVVAGGAAGHAAAACLRVAARRHPAVLRAREAGAAGGIATRTTARCTAAPRRSCSSATRSTTSLTARSSAPPCSRPCRSASAPPSPSRTHEVPQEVGDFAVLLHAGYSRRRALLLNVLSGVAALVGRRARRAARRRARRRSSRTCSAWRAASFLYVAMADLIPDLHSGRIAGRGVPAAAARRRRRDDGVFPLTHLPHVRLQG